MSRRARLILVYVLAAIVSAAAFSPLVIPAGVVEPRLLGMPRTLWAGILVTAVLVFMAYLAARFSPSDEEDPEDAPPIDTSAVR